MRIKDEEAQHCKIEERCKKRERKRLRGNGDEQRVQVSKRKQERDTAKQRKRGKERVSGRITGELETERTALKCQETVCGK